METNEDFQAPRVFKLYYFLTTCLIFIIPPPDFPFQYSFHFVQRVILGQANKMGFINGEDTSSAREGTHFN